MNFLKKYLYHPVKNFIAKNYLALLRKVTDIKVIGITGSAGKTSVKEIIAAILKEDAPTVWSKANIDPVYNISSTILRCTLKTKYLVLEMGVEHKGEMEFYLSLATPDIGVMTNIFPAHTEFFGDIEGVFKEKSVLVRNTDYAVLNKNDSRLYQLGKSLKSKVYWFGTSGNLIDQNLEAAKAVAKILKISDSQIGHGLKNYKSQPHRLNLIKHPSGAFILDDTYNSNPEAFIASLKYFLKIAGKNTKVAVVGDMLELGRQEISEHKRIGNEIRKNNFNKVISVGRLAKYVSDDNFPTWDKAVEPVRRYLQPNIYIFIKGSRSIGLDRLVDQLL